MTATSVLTHGTTLPGQEPICTEGSRLKAQQFLMFWLPHGASRVPTFLPPNGVENIGGRQSPRKLEGHPPPCPPCPALPLAALRPSFPGPSPAILQPQADGRMYRSRGVSSCVALIPISISILPLLRLRNVLQAEHRGREWEGLHRAGRWPVQGEDLDLAPCTLLPAPDLRQRPREAIRRNHRSKGGAQLPPSL